MATTLAERVKSALAGPPKKTQRALAQACGVSAPSVNGWVTGETKSIEGTHLLRAAAFLGVNPRWLGEGIGPREIQRHSLEPIPDTTASTPIQKAREVKQLKWPYPHINEAKLRALRGEVAQSMEDAILAAAARLKIDVLHDRGNKTGT